MKSSIFDLFKKQLWWMILSTSLTVTTILSSIGLMSLSGWFISFTAYASLSYQVAASFNFIVPATGVRFFSLARTASRYGERVVSHQATFKLLTDIRLWVYQKLEPLAPGHLLKHRKGDLLNRMVSDVDALDNLFIRVLAPTASAIIIACFAFFFFSFFNIHIAYLSALSILISGFCVPFFMGFIAKNTSRKLNLTLAQLKTETVEYIQGLSELIIFNQIETSQEKLQNLNEKVIQLQKKMAHFQGIGQGLIQLILWITITIGLYLSVTDVINHQLNGANIALIALGFLAMFEAVMALPTAYQYLGKTKSALNRLTELEKSKPFVTFSKTDHTPILKNYDIEFKNISFSYSNRNDGLTKFNLSINENQKIAIMGKTGAGKSTLLHLLARSFDVTDGEILIGDINIKNFSEDFLRKTVTFIEQKPHLFNQSIRDNLKLANEAKTDEELLKVLEIVSLKNHIESLEDGLDTIISEFGANFSGGQIRRLSLARALLSDAPIILLDEPTEGLDRKMEIEVIQAINKISQNKTVILVTHSVYAANEMEQIVHLSTT